VYFYPNEQITLDAAKNIISGIMLLRGVSQENIDSIQLSDSSVSINRWFIGALIAAILREYKN
jgi:hypothetical protein